MNIKLTEKEALHITRQVLWCLMMEKRRLDETKEINDQIDIINKTLNIIGQ